MIRNASVYLAATTPAEGSGLPWYIAVPAFALILGGIAWNKWGRRR